MSIGNKRHRIEIQDFTPVQDETGQEVEDGSGWVTSATRWASITPLSGRELVNATQVQPDVSHKVQMRYMAGITAEMRLKFGTRIFNISSVINVGEKKKELLIMCIEQK